MAFSVICLSYRFAVSAILKMTPNHVRCDMSSVKFFDSSRFCPILLILIQKIIFFNVIYLYFLTNYMQCFFRSASVISLSSTSNSSVEVSHPTTSVSKEKPTAKLPNMFNSEDNADRQQPNKMEKFR